MKSNHFAKNVRANKKNARERVRVLAFGTFDVLHAGHVRYLQDARKLGDELHVIVARDANVEKSKGHFPVQDEKNRVEMVSALACVDRAVLGNEKNIFMKVVEINPDIIALGYDQKPSNSVVKNELARMGLHPQIKRLKPYRESVHKSSLLKARIVDHARKMNQKK